MSMGRWPRGPQDELWITAGEIAKGPGRPFYAGLRGRLKPLDPGAGSCQA